MFRVKICGLTSAADALAAVEAGADALGLNFYEPSPRSVSVGVARQIAAAVPRSTLKVGVFVNASAEQIRETAQAVGLDLIQLHGDEPCDLLVQLRPLPVMRAFRVGNDLTPMATYLTACYQARAMPRLVLLDALRRDQYGGTGATLDWGAIHAGRRHLTGAPLVLAGGLQPDNVAEAIRATRPWAVDTASGVETSPGKKSADLMRRFVANAREALVRNASRQLS